MSSKCGEGGTLTKAVSEWKDGCEHVTLEVVGAFALVTKLIPCFGCVVREGASGVSRACDEYDTLTEPVLEVDHIFISLPIESSRLSFRCILSLRFDDLGKYRPTP